MTEAYSSEPALYLVAEVLSDHTVRTSPVRGNVNCLCGWRGPDEAHATHVARELLDVGLMPTPVERHTP